MVSKRSLRPDPNFDLLISKIYPSRDEYEAHQERVLAKLNKSHSQAALVNSITEGIKLQSQNRPQRSRKNANESENASNATSYNTSNPGGPTTPNSSANAANQNDSSQSATGSLNSSSGGIVNNSQNANSISQSANSPAVSGKITTFPKFATNMFVSSAFFLCRSDVQEFHHTVAEPCESTSETAETTEEPTKF